MEDMIKLGLILLGGCIVYFVVLGLIELIHDFTHPDDDEEKK